jgi:hypothetical protein
MRAKKTATKREVPRLVEHKALGVGTLKCVRVLDNGAFAAVAEFGGTERVVRLDQQFWITSLFEIMQAPLEPARKYKPETKAAEPEADEPSVADPEETELLPGVDGHLREIDPPEDEDVEREDGELVSESA